MVKKIEMLLLCSLLGSSLYGGNVSEAKGFIGLEVGAASVQADVGGFFAEKDYDGSAAEFGLRIGAQTEEWRTTFAFDYYDSSDDDQNMEKGFLLLDYYFLNGNESAVKPFIGLNVGYVNYESTFIEDNGFLYGAQAGFAVDVAETMELDLSYRYSLSNADALDHTASVVFGLNYLY
ncbi:MAG: hypothetical protein U9O24_08555 [Campylobacterota bacterium]|nr:hypothetical protein [Campylobacterota bacterium]